MRLIDESSVIENIEEWIDSVGDVVIGKGLSSYAELMGCIEEAPTAEAKPVRHGHWVNSYAPLEVFFNCSVCGGGWYVPEGLDIKYFPFCPNCGAKMDGMVEE